MSNKHIEAISNFIDMGKKLPNVYDLLLRGSLTSQEEKNIYCDIDLSIIFNFINFKELIAVNRLKEKLNYDFKISITVVSKEEFFSAFHHHGIKPLWYNYILSDSISLLKKEKPNFDIPKSCDTVLDSYNNLNYLLYTFRSSIINNKYENMDYKQIYQMLKYIVHFLRNAIFMKSNMVDEKLNIELTKSLFPKINPYILNLIKQHNDGKINLECIMNREEVLSIFTETFEYVLKDINSFMEKYKK